MVVKSNTAAMVGDSLSANVWWWACAVMCHEQALEGVGETKRWCAG